MATYLELCQKVARKSGAISGTYPAAVTGQEGRLQKIVEWTAEAWVDIQNLNEAWMWMRREFSGETTAGTAKYTAAALNITDLARWVTEPRSMTLYLKSAGVAQEGEIRSISWSDWRRSYGRGLQVNNQPSEYAISPQNELCFGAVPDDTYVVNGEYFKTPQVLAANGDIPELPPRFHDIIFHKSLMKRHAFHENAVGYAESKNNYQAMLTDLERDQLPKVTLSGTIA